MERCQSERGAIMLEALIVYPVTIFLLFFVLALFSIFYHIWNIQAIANEAAVKAAQTYKYKEADIEAGYVSAEQVSGLERYRYLFWGQDIMEADAGRKIEAYINRRLDHTSFVNKLTEPEIEFKIEKDALSNRHVEVVVTEEFTVPFGDALSYFGYDNVIHYEAVAYADCLDIIDYINTVDFVGEQTKLGAFGSKTLGMVDAVLKLFDHIIN